MQVDVIDTLDALKAHQGEWEAVYVADPEAQFYVSWPWILSWFEDNDGPWGRFRGAWR